MLRNYETMYIVRPTLDDDGVELVAKKLDDQIAGIGGEVEKTEKRGRKRLSYEVKDFKEGVYVLTTFKADASQIKELERLIKLNDDVIRHITVRREEA
jgi:small subunit ribosomal protein S6